MLDYSLEENNFKTSPSQTKRTICIAFTEKNVRRVFVCSSYLFALFFFTFPSLIRLIEAYSYDVYASGIHNTSICSPICYSIILSTDIPFKQNEPQCSLRFFPHVFPSSHFFIAEYSAQILSSYLYDIEYIEYIASNIQSE